MGEAKQARALPEPPEVELMDRDAVPCLEKLQLMNEAKVEVCISPLVSAAVG